MEENVQELLKDKNEDIVQFNFENNTSSPVAVNLFDTATLSVTPTSGNQQTNYTSSGDLLPSLLPSVLTLNTSNGLILSADPITSTLRVINSSTNTTNNNFDNVNGFDNDVNSLATQSDGKILAGGQFTQYKGINENYIIRLNADGTKDLTFDNSIGFNNEVDSIAIQSDGKILVGGFFTTYKGVSENYIIRLNSDGTKDLTFDNSIGFNNRVRFIAIQSDGKIICGGEFGQYKGVSENRIIRLNANGTKDLTFDNSIGFNLGVFSLALQSDGKILCGGGFTTYKGISANSIIRLNSNGLIDGAFNYGIGFNSLVRAIAIQSDGKIIVGGQFTQYKGVSENYIIRLISDGSKDITFDNSIGFTNAVFSVAIQSNGKIVCGGNFSSYKGISARRIVILNSDGSKDLTFDSTNGFDTFSFVSSINTLNDGTILLGGRFNDYNGFLNENITKLDSNGNLLSILQVNNISIYFAYCPSNNSFYNSSDSIDLIKLITGDGNSVGINIAIGFGTRIYSLQYNSNNNYLYAITQDIVALTSEIYVIDCSTNSVVTSIPLPNYDIGRNISSVTSSNEIYFYDNTTSLLQKIDCSTNTLSLINLSLPTIVPNALNNIQYSSNNNLLYITGFLTSTIDVVNTITDTYLTSITIPSIYNFVPLLSAINPVTNQLFITDFNTSNPKQYAVIDCNTNSIVSINSLSSILGRTFGVIYNSLTNSMYISGSLFSVVTFTASPFFIGGSANYNTFVNSLNFEPIFIEEIRILTQNQTQLYNQVQFTKIDSNGNQIFFPEFPITKVDSFQAQGNIAGLKLNGLVFDGRTYINQYVINPNQIVSFEIYYKQLDRFTATATYPIFFKPKVQLKEYIRKDYSDYDVEM